MSETNMDTRKNPEATVPVMEFRLPFGEIDMELEVGELGQIVVPVEVISKADGSYTFRKTGKAASDGNFRPEALTDMRKRLLAKQKDEE